MDRGWGIVEPSWYEIYLLFHKWKMDASSSLGILIMFEQGMLFVLNFWFAGCSNTLGSTVCLFILVLAFEAS